MRVAFLVKRHYTGQDLIHSGFGRYGQLPLQLAGIGHTVEVFALDFRREKPPPTRSRDGVAFRSFPAVPLAPPTRQLKEAIRRFAPEVVIAGGHVNMGTYARVASDASGAQIVFDLYDYYPAFFSRAARPLGEWLWRRSFRASDAFIAASPALGKTLGSFANRKPVHVLRNGFDPTVFAPTNRSEARRELFSSLPSRDRIVGYFGGITPHVALPEVFEALDRLDREERIATRLVHAGPQWSDAPSTRYTPLGPLPQQQAARVMAACDVVLAPYRDSLQVRYSNACKLSEYAAVRAIAVASRNGDWRAVIPPDYPGLFAPGNTGDLYNALYCQLRQPRPLEPVIDLQWSRQGAGLAAWIRQYSCPE